MKHCRLMSRKPQTAQVGGGATGGGSTIQVILDFLVTLVDRGFTIFFNKSGHGTL
jgi:hypothetical protein